MAILVQKLSAELSACPLLPRGWDLLSKGFEHLFDFNTASSGGALLLPCALSEWWSNGGA